MSAPAHISEIDTPALVIDLDVLEANLARMSEYLRGHGVQARPHVKSHKTWELAQLQLDHGAIGHTVAKVGEAESMVEGGFKDLLIAYPVLGSAKIHRVGELIDAGADITIALDSVETARRASADLAYRRGREGRLGVLIEIDTGMGRCGVQSISEAMRVASEVASLPQLRLRGVMGFSGHSYEESDDARRLEIGRAEGIKAVAYAKALAGEGHEIDTVSVGSTPSTYGAVKVEGVTEARAGVYVFNDRKQATLDARPEDLALTVASTVVSRPTDDRFVLDAGMKAMAGETYLWGTYGCLLDDPETIVSWAAEEHGVVEVDDAARMRSIGDMVRVVPNHACGTVNMHDFAWVVRGEKVVDCWQIRSRGRIR